MNGFDTRENDDCSAISSGLNKKQNGPENISISGPNLLSMPENDLRQTKIRALSSSIVPNHQAGLGTAVCLLCYRLNAHNFAIAKLDGD